MMRATSYNHNILRCLLLFNIYIYILMGYTLSSFHVTRTDQGRMIKHNNNVAPALGRRLLFLSKLSTNNARKKNISTSLLYHAINENNINDKFNKRNRKNNIIGNIIINKVSNFIRNRTILLKYLCILLISVILTIVIRSISHTLLLKSLLLPNNNIVMPTSIIAASAATTKTATKWKKEQIIAIVLGTLIGTILGILNGNRHREKLMKEINDDYNDIDDDDLRFYLQKTKLKKLQKLKDEINNTELSSADITTNISKMKKVIDSNIDSNGIKEDVQKNNKSSITNNANKPKRIKETKVKILHDNKNNVNNAKGNKYDTIDLTRKENNTATTSLLKNIINIDVIDTTKSFDSFSQPQPLLFTNDDNDDDEKTTIIDVESSVKQKSSNTHDSSNISVIVKENNYSTTISETNLNGTAVMETTFTENIQNTMSYFTNQTLDSNNLIENDNDNSTNNEPVGDENYVQDNNTRLLAMAFFQAKKEKDYETSELLQQIQSNNNVTTVPESSD